MFGAVPAGIDLIPVQVSAGVVFEKTIAEHGSQQCTAGIIQVIPVDLAIDGGGDDRGVIVGVAAVGGNACGQGLIGSLYLSLCCIMFTAGEIADSAAITDDK